VTVRVGGKDHTIDLARRKFERGITFEVPRSSLMTAVEYEVFDDLLIGNFMKTTLHGSFTDEPTWSNVPPGPSFMHGEGSRREAISTRARGAFSIRRSPPLKRASLDSRDRVSKSLEQGTLVKERAAFASYPSSWRNHPLGRVARRWTSLIRRPCGSNGRGSRSRDRIIA
jgi:hypothetical protein